MLRGRRIDDFYIISTLELTANRHSMTDFVYMDSSFMDTT